MTPETAELYARGERRLSERRSIALPASLETQLLNRITADRDQLKADNAALRKIIADYAELLNAADMLPAPLILDSHGAGTGREDCAGSIYGEGQR